MSEVVEDTTRLSLEGSRLFPIEPVLVQKDEGDTFTRELLSVQWRPRDPIYLYVIRPRDVPSPPVVLYSYSYPSELDRFKNDRFCRAVTEGGLAAVGFTPALTGHRYKNRPMKEWFVSELQEALVVTVHDVLMVMDYLVERGDLDASRTGFFGQGSGGTIAILAAALDPRIRVLDVINPWGDWGNWMRESGIIPETEREDFLKEDYLSKIAALDPVGWLPKLENKQVRLQLIQSDPVNPGPSLRRIAQSAQPGAVVQFFADTRAHADHLKNSSLFDWIKDKLCDPVAANVNPTNSP
ncbi:MAG: alpha/beta hydrolase [Acidobacteria bacterium]|nr:alpha/beta hydrolase [Acidobacteriota bacterium]